jgi:hypothetical protein
LEQSLNISVEPIEVGIFTKNKYVKKIVLSTFQKRVLEYKFSQNLKKIWQGKVSESYLEY